MRSVFIPALAVLACGASAAAADQSDGGIGRDDAVTTAPDSDRGAAARVQDGAPSGSDHGSIKDHDRTIRAVDKQLGADREAGDTASSNATGGAASSNATGGAATGGMAASGTSSGSSALTQDDRDFIMRAASGGMFEVKSSQLLLGQHVKDQKEHDFARMMVEDHSKANRQLLELAQRRGIVVATQLAPEHQRMLDDLKSLSGDELQKRYEQYQAAAHNEAISLFQREANDGRDPDLKQFAQQTLPTLQQHAAHLESHERMLDNK